MEITLDDAKTIVNTADTNKDGRISYDGKWFEAATQCLIIQMPAFCY